MALTRNGSHQLSGLSRFHGAVGAYGLRAALDNNGKRKNFDSGAHTVSGVTNKAAIPDGFRHPMSWKMGTKAGSLSSHVEADLTVTGAANGLRGLPGEASASFSITTNTPSGELIVSGTGTATLLLDTNTPLLTASLNGAGSASFTVETNIPLLGAEASLVGTTTMVISFADADILPLDDSPVLRDATASFSFAGTLQSYAVGYMEGTTEEAGLTPTGIANTVWAKVIEAGYSAEQILRLLAAYAAGSATGLEGANPQFTGLDGVTLRIDGAYSAGTRTIDALDGD